MKTATNAHSAKPLSVVICGAGNIAQHFDTPEGDDIFTHVKGYLRHGGFRVCAILDAELDRARAAAVRWGIPHGCSSLAEVRALGIVPDVVSICTPDDTHAAYLRECLAVPPQALPKAVFCEKPLALSVAEASEIVQLYEAAGVFLAVNYSRRWLPELQNLSNQAASGEFGAIISARVKYYKGFLHNGSHLVDVVNMFTQPDVLQSVIVRRVYDYGEHDPTLTAACLMKSKLAALQTEENSEFSLMIEGYDGRKMSPIEAEFVFERVNIRVEELNGMMLTVASLRENATYPGFFEFSDRQTISVHASRAMSEALAAIYDAVMHDALSPLASTGKTALETLVLCEKIREGIRS